MLSDSWKMDGQTFTIILFSGAIFVWYEWKRSDIDNTQWSNFNPWLEFSCENKQDGLEQKLFCHSHHCL